MRKFLLCVAFIFILLFAAHADAQGCSQCRDNVAQSSAATQAAFRHTIYLLGGAALIFCGVVFVVARSFGSEKD